MVGSCNKEATTDDVAESDRDKITKHTGPEIITRGKEAGWEIIHVGDGVLKAADNKEHDWEDDSKDFARDIFGGGGQPNSKIDQKITEDT